MQRKQYTAEYKAKIVIEILREEQTISEIASREQINVKQLHNWKKEFCENAARVFSEKKDEREARQRAAEQAEKEEILEKKVGQLTLEVDFLKKKSAQILGADWERKTGFKRR